MRTKVTDESIYTFTYNAEGHPFSMTRNGTTYYYICNLQGDVVKIVNSGGKVYAEYTYDAWGNTVSVSGGDTTSMTIANGNPLRYRGYIYDSETGFYYLESRYYDPVNYRFINADVFISTDGSIVGTNMFAYCENNPVTGYDPEGTINWDTFLKGASIALVGIMAIATVATAGCAAPALAGAIAIASGLACVGFGAAEIGESVTGHNIIRDDLMGGNEEMYNTVRTVAEVTATVSTMAVSAGAAANKAANPMAECFIAGTLVLTAAGCKPIEEVKPGDMVMASDPETGETALKEVVQVFRNETTEWVHLTIDGEEITCTPEHPFYSPVKGWTAACELRAGDILVTVNGEYVVLEKIQHELLEQPETTYNFEVEDFHTYYVGSTEVLVHNKCGVPFNEDQDTVIQIAKKAEKTGLSESDGNALWELAKEYGISGHGPKFDSYQGGTVFHMQIKGMHINIY